MSGAAARAEADSVYMRRALALARLGWGQTAPNPMVGAVVVRDGHVVGEGYHARFGEVHAEVRALLAAGDAAEGSTVFVTLEPCAHFGKTPPCADALIAARVARVVAAVEDPSREARGGAARLRAAGIAVDFGVERSAALELNAPFFHAAARGGVSARPWITLKLAVSADGAVADPSGVHRWITGTESRAHVHGLRANADAIAVGAGTVLADDPSLTVRDAAPPRVAPRRVVFDSSLRTPLSSTLLTTARAIETILVARDGSATAERIAAVRGTGATVLMASSLGAGLELLSAQGIRSMFVEGGPGLAGSLLRDGLVDRLIIFRSSLTLGAGARQAFADAPPGLAEALDAGAHRVVEERRFGDDIMTVYALHEVPCSPG